VDLPDADLEPGRANKLLPFPGGGNGWILVGRSRGEGQKKRYAQ
jgi:hypothetical protein